MTDSFDLHAIGFVLWAVPPRRVQLDASRVFERGIAPT